MSILFLQEQSLNVSIPSTEINEKTAYDARLTKLILKDGLLNPLIVRRISLPGAEKKFIVVDGIKRLKVLRALRKACKLPRNLERIPCILDGDLLIQKIDDLPLLVSEPELARLIRKSHDRGFNDSYIMHRFSCSQVTVNHALSLQTLNPRLRSTFNAGHLSLPQAAAFATISNKSA